MLERNEGRVTSTDRKRIVLNFYDFLIVLFAFHYSLTMLRFLLERTITSVEV